MPEQVPFQSGVTQMVMTTDISIQLGPFVSTPSGLALLQPQPGDQIFTSEVDLQRTRPHSSRRQALLLMEQMTVYVFQTAPVQTEQRCGPAVATSPLLPRLHQPLNFPRGSTGAEEQT